MSVLAYEPRPIEVLIADDHDLFALGLEETLAHYPDLVVVGRAADGAEAIAHASTLRPDVVARQHLADGLRVLAARLDPCLSCEPSLIVASPR